METIAQRPRLARVDRPYSPETTLLLAIARRTLSADARADAEDAIRRGVAWERWIPLADQHGVLPLAYAHLANGALSSTAIPATVVATLKQQAVASAHRGLHLTSELLAILRDFAAYDIAVVPLKGPVLAQRLYGSVGLRRFNDLDLLCHVHDVPRAIARLQARGYVLPELGSEWERRRSHHLTLRGPSGHRVELHSYLFRPLGRHRLSLDTISEGLEPGHFQGVPVQQMSAHTLLVYLCVHGAGHAWERLEWVCAIAELLRSGQIGPWDRIAREADRFQSRRRVQAALRIAGELLDAPMPESMGLVDPRAERAAAIIVTRLATNPARRCDSRDTYAHQLHTDITRIAQLRRSWATFCMPYGSDYTAFPLPKPLWGVYYVLRPFRLVFRYGMQFTRWLWKKQPSFTTRLRLPSRHRSAVEDSA